MRAGKSAEGSDLARTRPRKILRNIDPGRSESSAADEWRKWLRLIQAAAQKRVETVGELCLTGLWRLLRPCEASMRDTAAVLSRTRFSAAVTDAD